MSSNPPCSGSQKEREYSRPIRGRAAACDHFAAPIQNDIGSDRDPKSVITHKGNICENPNDRKHQYKEREHSCRTHCASPLRCYERSRCYDAPLATGADVNEPE